jgi:DNA-binding response OmpR family regulator
MSKKIFIIDDDINITNLVALYLKKEKYSVYEYNDSSEVYENFKRIMPDLLIMDIMMPDIDGFDLLKKIRRISDVSVIMLSSKGETFDKVLALELGADDYIVKPFEPNELLARVKAILRRSHISNNNENIIVLPNLTINLSEYTVDFFNDNLEIPKKEFELLVFLVKNKNQVFTRNQILSKIWGYDYLGNSRTVDVHIKRLRGKLEYKNPLWEIKTVWGVGYKFEMK